LHMATSRYARFDRPGHRMTGDRSKSSAEKERGVGYDFCHAVVDDHSRLAYGEPHGDEKAETVTAFTERALAFYASHGIEVKRLMTGNAWEYARNRSLRELLEAHGIRHIRTRPYRPQTNGKVERFHQTMRREWSDGVTYESARARARALPCWITDYNGRRPHSALADRPPISRVRSEPV
ncbi:MAG: transposase family protein, partial [Actinobacteria bacterium]|nr:transposase family protein [Actinomycetota bacterium]